jgi:hypothetical protein
MGQINRCLYKTLKPLVSQLIQQQGKHNGSGEREDKLVETYKKGILQEPPKINPGDKFLKVT